MLTYSTGSHTVTNAEFSLAANAAGPTSQTTRARVLPIIDLAALAAGDQFRVRVYETINGTQRVIHEAWPTGAQSSAGYVLPEFLLGDGWDVTIIKITGTDRSIGWDFHDDDSQALTEIAEGTNTLGAIVRLLTGIIAGPASGFAGSSIAWKSLDGSKTRATITYDASGRLTFTAGDLT